MGVGVGEGGNVRKSACLGGGLVCMCVCMYVRGRKEGVVYFLLYKKIFIVKSDRGALLLL